MGTRQITKLSQSSGICLVPNCKAAINLATTAAAIEIVKAKSILFETVQLDTNRTIISQTGDEVASINLVINGRNFSVYHLSLPKAEALTT
ncbi:hypothetical protein MJO28_014868 [Puccinia striiformis f. sp. tritici]|uniref:Uncharacterized protein n=1 Tax=Puccinia striiformis f. sp. tritici TaxID=168172 RepID=A0ACC0DTW3_9BASI|nr:hypothetical protein MJO28_014868 [Puccinia striiformis f. sp. tritici]